MPFVRGIVRVYFYVSRIERNIIILTPKSFPFSMLIKESKAKKKSWFQFGLKLGAAGIAFELAACGAGYFFYRRLNRDQGSCT